MAGMILIAPIAVTVWAIVWIGSILDQWGRSFLPANTPPGLGAVVLIVGVYFVGLLAQMWLFKGIFAWVEKLLVKLPGIKTVYESTRDLLKLFGGDANKMGKVVKYTFPDSKLTVLGILTNENPPAGQMADGTKTAAVYLPFSYMIGGVTVYARPEEIQNVDMPVEQAMKLCAIAFVGDEAKPELTEQK